MGRKRTVKDYMDALGIPSKHAGKPIDLVDRVRLALTSAVQEGILEGIKQATGGTEEEDE